MIVEFELNWSGEGSEILLVFRELARYNSRFLSIENLCYVLSEVQCSQLRNPQTFSYSNRNMEAEEFIIIVWSS